MKRQSFLPAVLMITSALMLALVLGCASKERIVTRDITTSGKNWTESEITQERKSPQGKIVIEKQKVFEKFKCIGQKGKHKGKALKIDSPEECLKAGGKIIDEVMVEEETIENR